MEPWHPVLDSPDDWAAHPGWRWPWWKFGMQPSDLFTTLSQQYNRTSIPLQDASAFHADVAEIAAQASDEHDFHRRMALRHHQRLDELIAGLNQVGHRLAATPGAFTPPTSSNNKTTTTTTASATSTTSTSSSTQWARGLAFFRNRSLDAIVAYFAGLVEQDETPAITQIAPASNPNKNINNKTDTTAAITTLVDTPLTPPALDDEPDISVVSTLDDSFSSQSNTAASLDDDRHTLPPTTIMNNLSPFRASPGTRRFVRSEMTVYSQARVSPIKFPLQSPQKPTTKRKSIVKKPQTSNATTQKRDAGDRMSTSSTSYTSRYNLRSQREQPASIFTKDNITQPSQNKRTRQDSTNPGQKRQRVS